MAAHTGEGKSDALPGAGKSVQNKEVVWSETALNGCSERIVAEWDLSVKLMLSARVPPKHCPNRFHVWYGAFGAVGTADICVQLISVQ